MYTYTLLKRLNNVAIDGKPKTFTDLHHEWYKDYKRAAEKAKLLMETRTEMRGGNWEIKSHIEPDLPFQSITHYEAKNGDQTFTIEILQLSDGQWEDKDLPF